LPQSRDGLVTIEVDRSDGERVHVSSTGQYPAAGIQFAIRTAQLDLNTTDGDTR
jgi:hypothetical protein